jgi:hypothetical protein
MFFILAVAFCLTFAGVLRSNNSIGMAQPAHAAKSKGSSGGSSSGVGSSSRSGGNNGGSSSSKKNTKTRLYRLG